MPGAPSNGRAAVAPLHAEVRPRERSGPVLELAQAPRPARPEDVPMRVVVPAYILSELKTGFQIGAALFLPVSGDGSGGGGGDHFDWHVAAAAGGDLDSAEDHAVRHG